MPPKKEEEEEDLNVYTKTPILASDGVVICLYNEAALSNRVTFENHTIQFDYQGYFVVNEDDNSSIQSKVDQIQQELFSALGKEAGLLSPNKKTESILEPSDISCQSLLGDYNNETPISDRLRSLRGKLKKEDEIFMLGLSSKPQDQFDTNQECNLELLPKKKRDKLSKKNLNCHSIQAGLTTYIATQGGGTVVDPAILETSILKCIKDWMEKDKFTPSDEEYSLLYLGSRRPITTQQDTVFPQQSALQGSNSQTIKSNTGRTQNVFTSYGVTFLVVLCVAFVSLMFLVRRKLTPTNRQIETDHQNEDDETFSDIFQTESPETSSEIMDETNLRSTPAKPVNQEESNIPAIQKTHTKELGARTEVSTKESYNKKSQPEVILVDDNVEIVASNS